MKLFAIVRLARPRQWTKNLLLFAGLLFSGRFREPQALGQALAGLAAFVLLSASVYALNDGRDADEDRKHPLKKHRPVAAGQLSQGAAYGWALVWAASGLLIGAALGPAFLSVALAYLAVSTLYSLWTKHQVILDVLSLASGFVLRAAAGALAVHVPISAWLLVCTTLLALFLGLGKRRAELSALPSGKKGRKSLEHYSLPLLDQMIAVVAAATLLAYSLYAFSAHVSTRGPWMMLTVPFVLYGIFRYLYLVHQKGLGQAPEMVLLGDRPLQLTLALYVAVSAAILWLDRAAQPFQP